MDGCFKERVFCTFCAQKSAKRTFFEAGALPCLPSPSASCSSQQWTVVAKNVCVHNYIYIYICRYSRYVQCYIHTYTHAYMYTYALASSARIREKSYAAQWQLPEPRSQVSARSPPKHLGTKPQLLGNATRQDRCDRWGMTCRVRVLDSNELVWGFPNKGNHRPLIPC